MPTTEERLAALEKQMAAWMDQRPTTYYTHQYSGEEIDNAVSRALPDGAIDQSVGTFVRPNLLDNWYFGNPVDQRKGYIQIGGTMMYKDAACTDQFGPSADTTPVVVYATYARPIDHGVELALYIPLNNIVRGYAGAGYAVDRWYFDTDSGSCSLTLTSEGLKFIATASATGIASLKQDIDPTMLSALAGKTVTLSLLGKTDITQQVLFYVNSKVAAVNFFQAVNGVCMTTLTYTFPEVLTGAAIFVYGRSYSGAGEGTIIAAKLELGPTQTLAHQENGVWVMNEVPDYGEQLRRCLRHDYILGNASQNCPIGIGTAYSNDGLVCVIQLPEYMRTNPAVALSGEVQIRFSATQILTATSVLNYGFSGDKVQLYFPGLSGLTPSQSCDLYTQIGSRLEFNSNL